MTDELEVDPCFPKCEDCDGYVVDDVVKLPKYMSFNVCECKQEKAKPERTTIQVRGARLCRIVSEMSESMCLSASEIVRMAVMRMYLLTLEKGENRDE